MTDRYPQPMRPLPEALVRVGAHARVNLPVVVRLFRAASGMALEIEVTLYVGSLKVSLTSSEWSRIPQISEIVEKLVRGEPLEQTSVDTVVSMDPQPFA